MTDVLKKLTEATRDLILPWRNAPEVRRQMYTSHAITPEEHRAWFERMQTDPSASWNLYYDATGEPMGVVYFTDIDLQERTAFWGFYAKPEAPAGTGTRILYAALGYAFNEMDLHKLNGEVLATNTVSLRLHEKCGFTREGVFREQHIDGKQHVDIIRFGLLAREWPEHSERLQVHVEHLDALAAQRNGDPAAETGTQDPPMNYVLATSRPWNEVMAQRLEEKTGHTFHLITRKEEMTPERLAAIAPRYVFLPHWSYIIPEALHSAHECVVFHMTDLPYGRGGSPLQNLIQRGHQETQLTALRCVAELDAGPIYMKRPLCLEGAASEIFLRAASEIESMIEAIIREEPEPQPQQGEPVVFRRRTPEESDLSNAPIQNLNDFFDFIRMLDAEGYPRAFLDMHSYRIEFSRAQLEQDQLVGTFVIYHKQNS